MFRSSLYILLILIFSVSCDDELQLNPLDVENNPDYEAPETSITSDINGTTLDTTAVTISFEGNELAVAFSYDLDSTGWSSWIDSSYVTLDFLDEGLHTFSVKGRYASMDEDATPANISFTVNAVTGPALMFYPRRAIVGQDSIVTFQILAEEVENLMLATINIAYDNTLIEIVSVSQGSMFTGSGESIFIDEIAANSLTIYAMLLGGDTPAVSGTGVLAEIKVKAKTLGSATLSLDGSQVFKSHEDLSISIQEKVNGLVVIQ